MNRAYPERESGGSPMAHGTFGTARLQHLTQNTPGVFDLTL